MASKTTNMVPVNTVIVQRDGKRVIPPVGKAFGFSAQEIEELGGALRKPLNEDAPASDAEVAATTASAGQVKTGDPDPKPTEDAADPKKAGKPGKPSDEGL